MSYNGKLLARAREKLESRRRENAQEQQRRLRLAYSRLPRLSAIDDALRQQMIELMGLTLRHGDSVAGDIRALRDANLALQSERAQLLAGAGLPADYTDEIYTCAECADTGMTGGALCDCLIKLYNRELTDELSALLRCGNESFDKFDLSYYDSAPDPRAGMSPRECMELVYSRCRKYAQEFGTASPNLLFQGGTGLGKTFLSACIARTVAEKGFSVAYESTAAALEAFETQKFSRDPAEADASAARVKQYLGCDLMILDDLGTEMTTSFSNSALYTVINTRLINARPTIISTNLSPDELSRRYTQQIVSRLDGEYLLLPFVGRDIRQIRKERAK